MIFQLTKAGLTPAYFCPFQPHVTEIAVRRHFQSVGEHTVEVEDSETGHGGVYKGRPPSIDVSAGRALATDGMGATEIAGRLGIARASVYRLLKAKEAPIAARNRPSRIPH